MVWTAQQIPQGDVTVLDGIGHYPMEEIEDFADLLSGWLAELDAGRSAPAGGTRRGVDG